MRTRRYAWAFVGIVALALAYFAGTQNAVAPLAVAQVMTPIPTGTMIPPVPTPTTFATYSTRPR